MVVVRDAETLLRMVELGYKPYYHRAVKRWYLRRGSERHIIARELEPLAKRVAEELEMKKSLEEGRRKEMIEEAVRLRAEGLPLQEVVERTGIPRTTFYRILDRVGSSIVTEKPAAPHTYYEAFHTPTPPEPPSVSRIKEAPMHGGVVGRIEDEEREVRGEKGKRALVQEEFTLKVPKPRRDPFIDFIAGLEDQLPPPLPRLFRRVAEIRCPKCGKPISIEVPEGLVRESLVLCNNCNALIRIEWVEQI